MDCDNNGDETLSNCNDNNVLDNDNNVLDNDNNVLDNDNNVLDNDNDNDNHNDNDNDNDNDKFVEDVVDSLSDIENDDIFNNDSFKNLAKKIGNKIMPAMNSLKDNLNFNKDTYTEYIKNMQDLCHNNFDNYLEFMKVYDKTKIDFLSNLTDKSFSKSFSKSFNESFYMAFSMCEFCDELEKTGFDKERLEKQKKVIMLRAGLPIYMVLIQEDFFKKENLDLDTEIFDLYSKNLMNKFSPLMNIFGKFNPKKNVE